MAGDRDDFTSARNEKQDTARYGGSEIMNDKPKIDKRLMPPMSRDGLYSVETIGGPLENPLNVAAKEMREARAASDTPAIPMSHHFTDVENEPSENGKPQSAMIDLAHTRFIIFAWPDQRWPLEIMGWIEGLMENVTPARKDYRSSLKVKNVECARNHAIKFDALGSDPSYKWFVFLDHDVRPFRDDRTTRFLRLQADVKCCEVKHGPDDTAYSWPTDFHEPIWCTSRKVLEAIEPPWFVQHYNEDHTQMVGCICKSFQKKVLESDFSIAHGGWAKHDRDGSWCG